MFSCMLCLGQRLYLYSNKRNVQINFCKLTSKLCASFIGNSIQASQKSTTYLNHIEKENDYASKDSQRKFTEIFRFPFIRIGFFLNKLKWYQTVAVSATIPATVLLHLIGLVDSSWILSFLVPGAIITTNLYVFSSFFHNAVGFMYISEDGNILKISYLDFWGSRIDKEFPVTDVMPFLDAPRPPTDFFFKQISFYSTETLKPKLFLKIGRITDNERFYKVFGPTE